MARPLKLAQLEDIPDGEARCVRSGAKAIALFRRGQEVFALDDECTHAGGPLSEGEFDQQTVTCPWHAACFDLRSGRVLSRPASVDAQSYPVRIENGGVWVELPG